MRRGILFGLVLALISFIFTLITPLTTANASDPDAPVYRRTFVQYPVPALGGSPRVRFCVSGPIPTRWHAWRAMKSIDHKVEGIRVTTKQTNCWKFRFKVIHTSNVSFWGELSGGTIILNSYYGVAPWVVQHELMHEFGMMHHWGPGLLKAPTPSMQQISYAEVRALRRAYPFPAR